MCMVSTSNISILSKDLLLHQVFLELLLFLIGSMALLEECDIFSCPVYKTMDNYYMYECISEFTVQFTCLNNFHHVSGERFSSCINGTWTAPDAIVCEVDYFMQRSILAPLIAGSTTLLSLILLAIDFYFYELDSLSIRESATRRHWRCGALKVMEFYERRQQQYYGKWSRKKLLDFRNQRLLREESAPKKKTSSEYSEYMTSSADVDVKAGLERDSNFSEKGLLLTELKDREIVSREQIKLYKKRIIELENEISFIVKKRDSIAQN